jgi:hypothetical protein
MSSTALNRSVVALLTNKSGGNLNYGDVVILDNTNDYGFTTTATGALSTRGIGVILEPNGIANNATGLVVTCGYCPKINLNTAATRGQFLKTHTVAGQATPHSSPQVEGDFGYALTASATPEAILFGGPNAPASGGAGTVTTTGSPASGQSVVFSGATSITSVAAPAICEGRLTTETGVPVSTSDRTAQGTIYWTPCTPGGKAKTNGQIALYDGTTVVLKSVTQITKALTITSGKNKNVYIDYNAGTPQIVLGADWTNDTTESETLVDQNGILVLSGTPAYRYVGVIRADGANTVADSGGMARTSQVGGKRFVWNAYNQVPRPLDVIDTTDSWSWTTNSWQQANANAGNQVAWVSGDAATLVDLDVRSSADLRSNSTSGFKVGVGLDSTSAFSGFTQSALNATATSIHVTATGTYRGYPGIGYHFAAWIEKGANGTCTIGGDIAGIIQNGMRGVIFC